MKKKEKPKYSGISNIIYALKNEWRWAKDKILFDLPRYPIELFTMLAGMYFPKLIIDAITMGRSAWDIAVLVVGYYLILLVLGIVSSYTKSRKGRYHFYLSMKYQSDLTMFQLSTDFQNTDDPEIRRMESKVSSDASTTSGAANNMYTTLAGIISSILGMASCAAIITIVSPWILVTVIIEAAIYYLFSRANMKYARDHADENADVNRRKGYIAGFSSNFEYAKDIKIYGMRGWIDDMFKQFQGESLRLYKNEQTRWCVQRLSGVLLYTIRNGISYFFLTAMLFDGKITPGDFVFMLSAVGSLASSLSQISWKFNTLHDYTQKMGWYREYYDIPERFNHGEGEPIPARSKMPMDIEFKDVSYKYPSAEGDKYALKQVNLKIKAGEKLAIVGRNGAGKTTLVKLLCGLYYPSEGEITLGGTDIKKFNVDEYYSLISAVFQDINIIPLTIAQFVAATDIDEEVNRDKAKHCLELAGLGEKIESLEKGIDSRLMKGIYDDSIDLSGGEKQKLMLARALYKNAGIVVLDEPTAALDPIAENELYLKYNMLTKGTTSLYISHRLASTRFCDRIIYIEDGEIAECGTHDELMAMGGKYAYMYGLQSRYYSENMNEQEAAI